MRFLPTGNEYVALPTIREDDGGIESINVLHMGFRGLIEMVGAPLLLPSVEVNGRPVPLEGLTWERQGGWVPAFAGRAGGLAVRGLYLAPVGQRGFITRLSIRAGDEPARVVLGFRGHWGETLHTINESKPLEGARYHYTSRWTEGPVLDFRATVTLFSLAPLAEGAGYEAPGDPERFGVWRSAELAPGAEAELTLFWGVGLEEVGAVTAAREMERTGFDRLLAETLAWLGERRRSVGDPDLDRVLNLNLLFNRFYATGRTLDTEELVSVTSRSPRYYVSAAYWDRDALYWSFPALLISDPGCAREMLAYAFGRQGRNVGIHSRYIDGVVLEPGFELDELMAPLLALEQYVSATGDRSVLAEPAVQSVVGRILAVLATKKHPQIDLYETFLLPTDDLPVYPYCTYDNVLVWRGLRAAAGLGLGDGPALEAQAERVRQAIWAHCVKEGRFAWEVDLAGRYRFYDEPPGSLQMLPFHGFCGWDDPVYLATLAFIRSPEYRHAFTGTPFEELGCTHAEHPWILSAANSLLMPMRRERARWLITHAPMDNGIACEAIDEQTGEVRTGAAFATCAGYLSYAIWTAFGGKEGLPHG
ncbi:MAG: glycoside hydrolase family 125 protein [Bacillota bacterium]